MQAVALGLLLWGWAATVCQGAASSESLSESSRSSLDARQQAGGNAIVLLPRAVSGDEAVSETTGPVELSGRALAGQQWQQLLAHLHAVPLQAPVDGDGSALVALLREEGVGRATLGSVLRENEEQGSWLVAVRGMSWEAWASVDSDKKRSGQGATAFPLNLASLEQHELLGILCSQVKLECFVDGLSVVDLHRNILISARQQWPQMNVISMLEPSRQWKHTAESTGSQLLSSWMSVGKELGQDSLRAYLEERFPSHDFQMWDPEQDEHILWEIAATDMLLEWMQAEKKVYTERLFVGLSLYAPQWTRERYGEVSLQFISIQVLVAELLAKAAMVREQRFPYATMEWLFLESSSDAVNSVDHSSGDISPASPLLLQKRDSLITTGNTMSMCAFSTQTSCNAISSNCTRQGTCKAAAGSSVCWYCACQRPYCQYYNYVPEVGLFFWTTVVFILSVSGTISMMYALGEEQRPLT